MLKLQIVYDGEDGGVVKFPAGGPVEMDLIDMITRKVISKGVAFKTSSHVEADIRDGVREALYDFKALTLKVPF